MGTIVKHHKIVHMKHLDTSHIHRGVLTNGKDDDSVSLERV